MRARSCAGALLAAALFVFCGCFTASVVPPVGLVYADLVGPIDTDTGSGKTLGAKRGESSVTMILFLVSTGDASVAAAARKGGISTIRHIDYEFTNVIGIYQKFTTVVLGD